jgi:hypothetical protein
VVQKEYHLLDWRCATCYTQGRIKVLGQILRQHGEDSISVSLERIDGPNGETKVRGTCPTCAQSNVYAAPQVRWERLRETLDEMEAGGEHERAIYPA